MLFLAPIHPASVDTTVCTVSQYVLYVYYTTSKKVEQPTKHGVPTNGGGSLQ